MFNLSDLSSGLEKSKSPIKLDNFNEIFRLQLLRLAPTSIQTGKCPMLPSKPVNDENVVNDECQVNQATKTLLGKTGITTQESSRELNPEHCAMGRCLNKSEKKLLNLCPLGPRKRSDTEFIQPADRPSLTHQLSSNRVKTSVTNKVARFETKTSKFIETRAALKAQLLRPVRQQTTTRSQGSTEAFMVKGVVAPQQTGRTEVKSMGIDRARLYGRLRMLR
jgi:hypothetical protein